MVKIIVNLNFLTLMGKIHYLKIRKNMAYVWFSRKSRVRILNFRKWFESLLTFLKTSKHKYINK